MSEYTHEFDLEDGRHVVLKIDCEEVCLPPIYKIIMDGKLQPGSHICPSLWNDEILESLVRKKYEA
jgi:hypothetical protein